MKEEALSQVFSGRNSSVAWFKLAELVARGEKEKALNLYRLLSHSFEERAYALQLEGDLLWSFEDEEAIDRYKRAAKLYEKSQKVSCAIAIYEHLLTLQPKVYDHLARLVVLYASLKWTEKFRESFDFLLDLHESNDVSSELIEETVDDVVLALTDDDPKNSQNKDSCNILKSLLKKRAPSLAERAAMLA